ncbi:unnamed protein product, partial [Heterosigma akashiwo]
VIGDIALRSQQRQPCFANSFGTPNQPRDATYFSCKQCNMNWICSSCAKCCHTDHELAVHIKNHNPSWACCYCPRKKNQCQLQVEVQQQCNGNNSTHHGNHDEGGDTTYSSTRNLRQQDVVSYNLIGLPNNETV